MFALVRADAVAVGLGGVGRLRQRVAERRVHLRVAAIADLRLQPVVVGDAEIHQHVDLAHAAVDRQDRPRRVGRGDGAGLPGRGAIERRRRVQIDRPIEIGPVLVDVVAADEQALARFRARRRSRSPGCAG